MDVSNFQNAFRNLKLTPLDYSHELEYIANQRNIEFKSSIKLMVLVPILIYVMLSMLKKSYSSSIYHIKAK